MSEPTPAPATTRQGPASRLRLQNPSQAGRTRSPWSLGDRVKMALWIFARAVLFRPTPKFFNTWRVFLLRSFGAKITGRVEVSASAIIRYPWKLTMEQGACLAPGSEVYNLGEVTLREKCTVAQYAYLCAGTHDLEDLELLPLVVGPIEIGRECFIGARALILPGVVVNEGAVIGAGAVVSKDMPAWMICAGNPCRPIKERKVKGRS